MRYDRLTLTVEGGNGLLENLKRIGNVREVAHEPGSREYGIVCGGDVRGEVFYAVVKSGAVLLGMTSPDATLEQIFLRLTGRSEDPV